MAHRRALNMSADMDMTPMIDVTFQLITFFAMTINFANAEHSQRIELPLSTLAQPREGKEDQEFITLHVDDQDGIVVLRGQEYKLPELTNPLKAEISRIVGLRRKKEPGFTAKQIPVILRGDRNAQTGFVQQVIEACQKAELSAFRLRADASSPE